MDIPFVHPILKQFINKDDVNIQTKKPEEKEEKELTSDDRMYLMSKKLDDSFLISSYLEIIKVDSIIFEHPTVNMNSYVFDDIELLSDHYNDESKSILSKINYTETKMGECALKNILSSPIYDINTLKKRQKLILDIGELKENILPKLKEIREIESDLIWFWNGQNMKHIDTMHDYIYFNYDFIPFLNLNSVLNKNEKALLITNIYKIIGAPLLTVITPIISLIVPLVFFLYTIRKSGANVSFGQALKMYFNTIWNLNPIELFTKASTKTMLVSFMTKAFYVFMYFQNVYYSVQSATSTNKIINIIHEKLNKMSKYIKLSNQIYQICIKNNIINLDTFIKDNEKIKINLEKSIEQFKDKTFDKEPGLLTHKGIILKVFQEFRLCKTILHSCFQYISHIDSIQSIFTLYNNSTENHPYCLTKYFENRLTPDIKMNNIWHPYLNQTVTKNTVKNDLHMKNNILITGPNAAGKSTYIKAVIINLIFAQTICLSSAKSFEMTPFYMIETYLQIPDSKGSESLFEAEMYRSRDYLEKLKVLEEHQFSFIVLDEIFSSTNYVEGFSGAYAILKKISTFKNTLSMTTTHYSDLECLEKDTNGRIENYKFEVDIDNQNNINFNYILKKGTSRQYIALQLLKQNGFDNDLIESAIEMSKKISVKKSDSKKSNSKKNKKIKKSKTIVLEE